MVIKVGVENFAKIKRAEICVNKYTLIVGPNNSGKSFLMQLVQGLSDELLEYVPEEATKILLAEKQDFFERYIVEQATIAAFVECVNKKLNEKKEEIVQTIFGKSIPIGKIYIVIELSEDEKKIIDVFQMKSLESDFAKELLEPTALEIVSSWKFNSEDDWISTVSSLEQQTLKLWKLSVSYANHDSAYYMVRDALGDIINSDSMYFPASRTGLMLLYKDFFANSKMEEGRTFRIKNDKVIEDTSRYGGLTRPIFNFLKFLQMHQKDESGDVYESELQFFESKLIDGHISVGKQGNISYQERLSGVEVPIYLASSMIKEVTPIALGLTSQRIYNRFIVDEIEGSLHPEKQMELIRFFNRLYNRGISMILSTHSDTIASKLNNLYCIQNALQNDNEEKVLKLFGIEKSDLLPPEALYVYEVLQEDNQMYIFEEKIPNPKQGYQFDLFTKAAIGLYEETMRLGEIV